MSTGKIYPVQSPGKYSKCIGRWTVYFCFPNRRKDCSTWQLPWGFLLRAGSFQFYNHNSRGCNQLWPWPVNLPSTSPCQSEQSIPSWEWKCESSKIRRAGKEPTGNTEWGHCWTDVTALSSPYGVFTGRPKRIHVKNETVSFTYVELT